MHRRSRPLWLILPLLLFLILLLAAAYIGALAATVDASRLSDTRTANDRDLLYLAIHAGLLCIALAAGYGFGKWANGLGVAFGLLLVVVLSLTMVGVQMGSYALACNTEGNNNIVRHWTC